MGTPYPPAKRRQTTLGEGFAALRASAHPGSFGLPVLDVDQAMEMLRGLPACSVCGWTKRAHEGAQRSQTCGRFAP